MTTDKNNTIDLDESLFTFIVEKEDPYRMPEFQLCRKLMVELIRNNVATFLLLKDDNVRLWWEHVVYESKLVIGQRKTNIRKYKLRMSGYNKLTEEERKLIGLRKPAKPSYMAYFEKLFGEIE